MAPYTGDTPLKPKKFWRYLGFFFDRRLSFQEHVRYYSTKALSTVKAMRVLGNSNWGLSPLHKRLLYRACVLPIAMYGFRLWCFERARVKGHLKALQTMQRCAAIWITGVFRTSPTGGVEAIAGLIPIDLHLNKLDECAVWRTGMLHQNHGLRAFLSNESGQRSHSIRTHP